MILDHLDNCRVYERLHSLFPEAFAYLRNTDFTRIENGNYEINGTDLFAIVNSYETQPPEERAWEAHKKYIDIQFIVSGSEQMGVAPLAFMREVQPYDAEKDFYLLDGPGTFVEVNQGYFTVFFPADVHMPNLIAKERSLVKKVVIKVRIEEPAISICFATNNPHKLKEVRAGVASTQIAIKSLVDCGIHEHLPENGTTLEINSWQKADHIYSNYGVNCFADDTGLEVEALDGKPGVYSARYAGPGCSSADNVEKLLRELNGESHRNAAFRTVICLILGGAEHRFEGKIKGRIAEEPRGSGGFGYDSVFIPEGYDQTFAEMSLSLKNSISHRAIAVDKLVRFLSDELLQSEI